MVKLAKKQLLIKAIDQVPFGTVDTSQQKYGNTLDLFNEIITAYESGDTLATTTQDVDALSVFRSEAMENNKAITKVLILG